MAQATTLESDLAPTLAESSVRKAGCLGRRDGLQRGPHVDELVERLRARSTRFDRPWEVVLRRRRLERRLARPAAAAHERDPRIRVVLLKRNFGQHPAMAAGMQASRADIVVTMDGDLQNDPSDIPQARAPRSSDEGVEVASGRRSGSAPTR